MLTRQLILGCLASVVLSTAASAATFNVVIKGYKFVPANLKVHVGDMVVWTNKDPEPHTVTAQDGAFESGGIEQGATFAHTYTKAGSFGYDCSLHEAMHANILVGH